MKNALAPTALQKWPGTSFRAGIRLIRGCAGIAVALLWPATGLGEGVVSEPTEIALRAAMAGGGTVTIACDGVIRVYGTLTNQGDTTIDGAGHQVTISGNAVRVFYLPTNQNLTLMNLALAEGKDQQGAGIFNDGGTLTLVGIGCSNNWATTYIPSGQEPPLGAAGGAIYNRAGTVLATNCTFACNEAVNPLAQDPWSSNPLWAARGGALFNDAGVMRLERCLLVGNRVIGGDAPSWEPGFNYGVKAWGGAIYSTGPLSLNECTLRENSATAGKGSSNNTWTGPGAPGAEALGGAVWSEAELVIKTSTFANNRCVAGAGGEGGRKSDPSDLSGDTGGPGGKASGGGLYSQGYLAAAGSSFISNTVAGGQGGKGGAGGQWAVVPIGQPGGPGGNSGSAQGSALFTIGQASLVNCTFAGNLGTGPAGGQGGTGGQTDRVTAGGGRGGPGGNGGDALGAIRDVAGSLWSTNCTVAHNTASAGAGGLGGEGGRSGAQAANPYGPPGPNGTNGVAVAGLLSAGGMFINTLLGNNQPGNAAGVVTDLGHNLSSDATPAFTNSSSMNGADPRLGPIADNGGSTLTVALLANSPAISAANPAAAPPIDQRGFHRPLGVAADIGACEYTFLNLLAPGLLPDGAYRFDVQGEVSQTYVIEASSNLLNWVPLQTNILNGTVFPFADTTAKNYSLRWYRAVLLPANP